MIIAVEYHSGEINSSLSVSTKNKKEPLPKSSFMLGLSGSLLNDYKYLKVARRYKSGEVQL